MHRKTANEPLRIVQQTSGQDGFEAWRAIVRRYYQRNTSDINSAYAALISNISEKDRAKDVFDDILRTFINDTNRFENRFGMIRDQEKMLAVKKFMPESLLNCRFRGTTMSYSELFVALENIIIDKVATVPTARSRKIDTSAAMEIGLTAKEHGENASQEGDQRIVYLALQAVHKEIGKGNLELWQGSELERKRWQRWQRRREETHGRKGSGKKGSKGQDKGGKGETRTCWTCGKTGHIAAWCGKGGRHILYAIGEDDIENIEESADNEEDSASIVSAGRK